MAIAPARARRPGAARPQLEAATEEELETCPFCEGREDRTPPETLALGREGGEPNGPGWRVRVVPNLYPALERQEVVVHTPWHARSLAELSEEELALVAGAWRARATAGLENGFRHVFAFVNEGREAGASRPHSHSQLAFLPGEPPVAAGERSNGCRVCAAVGRDLRDPSRVVAERGDLVLACPYAPRSPFELLIAPAAHERDAFAGSAGLEAALALLGEAVRRLHAVEGVVPLNAWLHTGAHWHLEMVPRLSILAGLELGAGIYVTRLSPEDAAGILRAAEV